MFIVWYDLKLQPTILYKVLKLKTIGEGKFDVFN